MRTLLAAITRAARPASDRCAMCAAGRHGQCNDESCTCCYGQSAE